MSTILVAGDSHIVALGAPLRSDRGDYDIIRLRRPCGRFFGVVGGGPRERNEYWGAVRKHASGRIVAILWEGNRHLGNYLFSPRRRFDLVISEQPELPIDETAELLPEAALRALFWQWIEPLGAEIEALKAVGGASVIVGTPPPKGDDGFIREKLCVEETFMRVIGRLGESPTTVVLSPPLLRYKLWMVNQSLLREVAEGHGVSFISVPRRAQTEDGFLRREYYAPDVTHTNRAYRDLMIDAIMRHFALDQANASLT